MCTFAIICCDELLVEVGTWLNGRMHGEAGAKVISSLDMNEVGEGVTCGNLFTMRTYSLQEGLSNALSETA